MRKTTTRRQILKVGTQAALALLCPWPISAAIKSTTPAPRSLSFYNTHTGEALDVCYFKNGHYDQRALDRINFILRDHRTGDIRSMDRDLLDLLTKVTARIDTKSPFHIISGYRSPATNAMLRNISTGVAKRSLHMVGRAIDIRLPHYDTRTLRNICIGLKAGGVGYYSRSNFVHIDTGRIRAWGS